MSVLSWFLGPLVGLECQRALARGWIILARALAGIIISGAALVILWIWWLSWNADPSYLPYGLLRSGLVAVEGMLVTISLVLTPAVLAGSLAGERERGALGLLLTTRVSPYEIICGRFTGKLTQVLMILAAGIPALVLLVALAGLRFAQSIALLALPLTVAFGGAGLALAISAVSRRGRDALLSTYLVMLVFVLMPGVLFVLQASPSFRWLACLNPYFGIPDVFAQSDLTHLLISMALWSALGIWGIIVATWRLAPTSQRVLDGPRRRKSSRRRGQVPAVDELRPMVWKELYVEKGGTLGGLGWWLAAALTLLLAGGSLCLAVIITWEYVYHPGDQTEFAEVQRLLRSFVEATGLPISWLIAWAAGLRAAVSVASERERGTWEAILTSPLESQEIIRAKFFGALYALRWLFGAAIFSWTIAWASGAMTGLEYFDWILGAFVGGSFMAVIGFRASLASSSSTRAMALTAGVWLVAQAVLWVATWIVLGFIAMTVVLTVSLVEDQPIANVLLNYRPYWSSAKVVTFHSIAAVATLVLLSYTRFLFDRLAGRQVGRRSRLGAPSKVLRPQADRASAPRSPSHNLEEPGVPTSP